LNGQVTQEWVASYNGPGNLDDFASSLAVDGSGNVYVTGSSYSTGTSFDYATIKYNSSGVQQWIARYNGPGNSDDMANSLAVDGSGNVYVTGTISTGTSYDYATIKYNSAGVQQWVAIYNGPGSSYDEANSLAVDGSGNVYVTGVSRGNGTTDDYATVKYNSAGVEQWVARYNGPGNSIDNANSLAVDGSGNVYLTGGSRGNGTSDDYATVKYNSSGVQLWVARYNGPGNMNDRAKSLAVDGSGNVYVTGISNGSVASYATVKYNSAGVQQWVARYNGPENSFDAANSLAVDGSGNVYVTGISSSGTSEDYATVKYNSAGVEQWVARYNGPGNSYDEAYSLAVDGSGNVYVTGRIGGIETVDYATIKYSQQSQPLPLPSISVSPIQINPGGSVGITGQNFRSNTQVKLSIMSSNSELVHDQVYTTGTNGDFNANYSSNTNSSPGIYTVSCRDIFVNQSSPNKTFEIKEPPETFDLILTSPTSDTVDRIIDVEWRDKMIPTQGYSILNIKRKYKYKVNYTTDNGNNWSSDIISEGYEFINSTPVFNKQISLPPLSSIQSGTNIKIKITDYINTSRYSESASIPIRYSELTKSNISLIWDFSYPDPGRSPKGVSADGVSRIYFKISKNSGSPGITSVGIQLTDDKNNTDKKYLGKLKIATDTNDYSTEANDAFATQITNSGQTDYWFWYVSPDDFVRTGAGDETKNQRTVTANIVVTYSDATTENGFQNVSIARPPLLFLHGIGSNGYLWNDYGINFIHLFKVIETPSYNSAFGFRDIGNALLNWNNENSYNPLSFQNAIYKMRNSGYSTNQVYYISHSMGGNIARAASEYSYYNSKQNYQKGYINRLITMDTPNNGSPYADFVISLLPIINNLELFSRWGEVTKLAIKTIIATRLNDLINSTLKLENNNIFSDISATESLRNLQISGNGSYKFKSTPIKSFLFAGDFFPGDNIIFNNSSLNFNGSEGFNNLYEYLDKVIQVSLYPNLINFFYLNTDQQYALSLKTKVRQISKSERVTKLLELIFKKFFNGNSSIFNSDLVVSVNSQLANTTRTSSNTYDAHNGNYGNFNLGVSHTSFFPNHCVSDTIIRGKIRNLINLPLSYNEFLQSIPNTPGAYVNSIAISDYTTSLSFDSSRVLNIIDPDDGHLCVVDSIVNITFNINDTANLQYVSVSFQGENYYDTVKSNTYNFSININGNELDSSNILASAVYLSNDSLIVSEDLKKVFIKTLSNPVEFEVKNNFYGLIKDDVITPKYKTVFSNFIYSGYSRDISAIIDNPSIVSFDNIEKTFKALSTGETFAIVSNGGLSDTIYFSINGELLVPTLTTLVFPPDSAKVNKTDLKLSWNIVNYASNYYLEVAKDKNFESIVYENSSLNDTITAVTDIVDSVTYYWRVKALNSSGSGDWSSVRSFTSIPLKESYYYVTLIPEGYYNLASNTLSIKDSVRVYLVNINPPYNIIDSSISVVDSNSFQTLLQFNNTISGIYYLKIKHRNSIETWSKAGGEVFTNHTKMYYDFTSSVDKAYGNNMILSGDKWCIYSGDINKDGTIDITDASLVDNDAFNFASGYIPSDINGDGISDITDAVFTDNNSFNFVSKITP